MKRKLAGFGFAFASAELAAAYLPPLALPLTAAVFVLLLLVLFIRRRAAALWVLPAAAGVLIGLAWHTAFCALVVAPAQSLCGQTVECTAVVQTDCEASWQPGTVRATLRLTEIDGQSAALNVYCTALPYAEPGDVVTARLTLTPLKADHYRMSRYAKNVWLGAECVGEPVWQGTSDALRFRLYRLRQSLSARLGAYLPTDLAGLEAAMLLADRASLPDETSDTFRAAGISHLLAVSGLHVALLCGLFAFGDARRRRFSRPFLLAQAAVLLFYMGLTGLPFSVLRAGLMFFIALAGCFWLQPPDTLTALGLAAAILGAVQPFAPCDVGFQLSFCGVLGVQAATALAGRQRRFFAVRRRSAHKPETLPLPLAAALRALDAVQAAVLATLATLPVLLLHGMMTSGAAVPSNLLVVWMLGPALRLGLLVLALSAVPFLDPVCHGVSLVLAVWLKTMTALAEQCAALPIARIDLPVRYTVWVLAVLAALALLYRRAGRLRRFVPAAVLCTAAAVALGAVMQRDVVRVTLVGTAGNPCAVITQNGRAAVLFRGGAANVNAVQRYLAQHGAPELTAVVDLRAEPSDASPDAPLYYALAEQGGAALTVPLLDTLQAELYHTSGGNFVVLDIGGWHAAMSAGEPAFDAPAEVDLFLAGGSLPDTVSAAAILCNQSAPRWRDKADGIPVRYDADAPAVVVRPGQSAVYVQTVALD